VNDLVRSHLVARAKAVIGCDPLGDLAHRYRLSGLPDNAQEQPRHRGVRPLGARCFAARVGHAQRDIERGTVGPERCSLVVEATSAASISARFANSPAMIADSGMMLWWQVLHNIGFSWLRRVRRTAMGGAAVLVLSFGA
jgi:hypothetical protein